MPCPPEVLALIERFKEQREDYQNPAYRETQLRIEFIDPLLKHLGWDIDNVQGFAEAYKEVIHEYSLKTKDATKAPDYCFRIGATRKFFLEAKKPAENIKEDKKHAYQLRRYAWSGNLPLSILTDFQEWAVYDTRIKPEETDKASTARVMFFTCDELAEKWDELAAIFSKQAIQKGSFDRYAESNKKKRGTGRVDSEFLAEIERWRDILAHNIALRNEGLSQRDLNFSVQRIIDRIIFLRIAEDRGIEDYGRLQALNGDNIYPRLMQLFRAADDRYNSGIFHFEKEKGRSENPDEVTPDLAVNDKVLRAILDSLYYPASAYEFSVLPADILGQVYEQFLGKVITLTPGHRAKVDEKPEVKKAGGVYYTPTYIVDYIVQQTVGKLLDGKTPKQAAKLTILDPACGSGSFLIGAYQFLLDWHLQWYVNDGPEKHRKEIYVAGVRSQGSGVRKKGTEKSNVGDWRLTSAERKRILLNNIYGVDIDEQAVEVTKLSLLLKVLEGENRETLDRQLRLVEKHRALPDLGSNIKCGNSLIGHDFYAGKQLGMFDDDERLRINTFEWKDEFPAIMKAGGFDAVIGNPPYVRIQGFPREQVAYLAGKYKTAIRNADLYVSFVEKGFDLINREGRVGQILPNKFFKTDYGEKLRETLAELHAVTAIVDFGSSQVFAATTYTCLLFLSKKGNGKFYLAKAVASPEELKSVSFSELPSESLASGLWTFDDKRRTKLIAKIAARSRPLLELPAAMSRGSSTGCDEVFMVPVDDPGVERGVLRTPLFATDFRRYRFAPQPEWSVIFPYEREGDEFRLLAESDFKKRFPRAYEHLRKNRSVLEKRKQYRQWYAYSAPRNLELHETANFVVPLLANEGSFASIPKNAAGKLCPMASGGFSIGLSPECSLAASFVLGILNSRLAFWHLQHISNVFRGGWITCTKQYVGTLPIPSVDLDKRKDKTRHDKIVVLVDQIVSLHEKLPSAKSDLAQAALQRQITATDRQIDELVYELYELTPEEIKIVEEATG
ncbi:MAG: Eco57I restriction-modification methylase domain-containing protein [Pirellulaceae bacterium]